MTQNEAIIIRYYLVHTLDGFAKIIWLVLGGFAIILLVLGGFAIIWHVLVVLARFVFYITYSQF